MKMDAKTTAGRRQVRSRNADGLKKIWEKKIEKQTMEHQTEDTRRNKSALSKLREEWRQMMEFKINMLHSLQEDQKKQLYYREPGSKANTAA